MNYRTTELDPAVIHKMMDFLPGQVLVALIFIGAPLFVWWSLRSWGRKGRVRE